MALLNGATGKQPAPTNDDLVGQDDEAGVDQSADEGDDSGEDDAQVLFTVLKNKDGSFSLVEGDEPDSEDGLAAPEGASPAEGGTPTLPQGKSFDEIGPLLKAVLDILRGSQGDGDEAAQSSFEDGFKSKET